MAKDISREIAAAKDDPRELAQKLFVKFWTTNSPVNERALAAMCFQGASAFLRVAAQVREGRDPAEIINPPPGPAEVSLTPSENTTVAA